MNNIAPFALMGLALVSAFIAQALLLAAREHVRARHPAWFEELASGGSGLRLGGPDDRARRKLARPLLFGLPERVRGDAPLMKLAERFRLAMLSVAASMGGLLLIIALRAQAAGG
jgi:hypothetical protein